MTTGKTIALTRWTFVGKVTSLLFMLKSLCAFQGGDGRWYQVVDKGDTVP